MRSLRFHLTLFGLVLSCVLSKGALAETNPLPDLGAPDAVIAQRVAAYDQESIARLYRAYSGLVWSTVQKVLGSDSNFIEDICQEVWGAMPRKIVSFNAAKGNLSLFITTMARNRAIDQIRSIQRRVRLNEGFQEARHMSPAAAMLPSVSTDRNAAFSALETAIARLPADSAAALRLYQQQYTSPEIAEMLGVPLGTIKARIRRAMATLQSNPNLRRLSAALFTCEGEASDPYGASGEDEHDAEGF